MAKHGMQWIGFPHQTAPHGGAWLIKSNPLKSMLKTEKQNALAEAKAAGTSRQPITPAFLKVPAAVAYSGIGRSTMYELMGAGKIRSHRIGAARVIDRESLDAFITAQPS
jgi:excisionase family DNA binding protein